MPILIPISKWEMNQNHFKPNFSQNFNCELRISTKSLLKNIAKIENRPEIKELDRLLMETSLYLKGKNKE